MNTLPLYSDSIPIVDEAEVAAGSGDVGSTLCVLRRLYFDDFGRLLIHMPHSSYPNLSAMLPAMASNTIQSQWTGAAGQPLLIQSLNFMRSLSAAYALNRGQSLRGKTILDFGCGYGRLLRLLYLFTDPEQIYGFDPWDRSIELCREAGVWGQLAISDYLPTSLPYENIKFDVIYCYSVFTHLSLRATHQALSTLRARINANGLIAITIRPDDYWAHDVNINGNEKAALLEDHRAHGFAFRPHNREPIDGDITYGDTTIALSHIRRNYPAWRIVDHDRTFADPFQIFVFLEPV